MNCDGNSLTRRSQQINSLSFLAPLYNLKPSSENVIVVIPPLCPVNLHKCLKVPSLWETNSIVFFHVPATEIM